MNRRPSSRSKDFALYAAISLAVVTGIIAAAESGVQRVLFERWFAVGMFSVFLFGQFIQSSKQSWRKRWFWVGVGVFAILHSMLIAGLITSRHLPKSSGWIVLSLVELLVLIGFRAWMHRAKR